LAMGDLVFFKIKKGRISHVGVYLGNDKFVHSSTRRGVIISDLNELYYKRTFFTGGRHKSLLPDAGKDTDLSIDISSQNNSLNDNQ
jgi:hypothetical protein